MANTTNTSILILNGSGLTDLNNSNDPSNSAITLTAIQQQCTTLGNQLGITIDFRQPAESDALCRLITQDSENYNGLIINPTDYSDTSNASLEAVQNAIMAIAHLKKPIIEVHINNVFLPGTTMRRPLQVPGSDIGFIAGLGVHGYLLAIQAIQQRISKAAKS